MSISLLKKGYQIIPFCLIKVILDLFEKFITKNNFKDQTVETVVRKYITNKSVMGISGRTNNRFISSLKKFLKVFLKDKYFNFINVKSPKFTNKLPNILNVEEVERLLNFCQLSMRITWIKLF